MSGNVKCIPQNLSLKWWKCLIDSPVSIDVFTRPNGSSQQSDYILSSVYTHALLSQDEEGCRVFVWANKGIVVCFLQDPFPAWSSTIPQIPPTITTTTTSPCLPLLLPSCSFHVNENAVFLLLYQITRKCVTLTLKDKTPPNIYKVPL